MELNDYLKSCSDFKNCDGCPIKNFKQLCKYTRRYHSYSTFTFAYKMYTCFLKAKENEVKDGFKEIEELEKEINKCLKVKKQ